MKTNRIAVLAVALFLTSSSLVMASGGDSARMQKRLGASIALGEPNPTLIGFNVHYNAFDFMRISAGYGGLSSSVGGLEASVSTFGASVKGMMPGWNLTPTLGLGYGHVSFSGVSGIEVSGFSASAGHLYASVGADYQSEGGFNASLGYGFSFKSGVDASLYLGLGWFFDI